LTDSGKGRAAVRGNSKEPAVLTDRDKDKAEAETDNLAAAAVEADLTAKDRETEAADLA